MANYWQRNDIKLRAFEERDIQMYVDGNENPNGTMQWYYDYILFPQSKEEVREDLLKGIKDTADDRRIMVAENSKGEYVGEVFVWHTDKRNRLFKYGIFLSDQKRGKGYGKDILIITLDYYFNELNYHKCCPTAYSFNDPSRRFHEKFGFKEEGRLREEVYTRGGYHDMIYYGMLKDEFNALYKHFS